MHKAGFAGARLEWVEWLPWDCLPALPWLLACHVHIRALACRWRTCWLTHTYVCAHWRNDTAPVEAAARILSEPMAVGPDRRAVLLVGSGGRSGSG